MNSNKNKKGTDPELYRICPSKLTKHELEDLYFTVLENNMQLRKTINEQEDKIKKLSTQMQMKYSAQKVFQAEERNNCCVATNIKVKQQKESLDKLRREHDKTAKRIRTLNKKLSSGNTSRTYPPIYSQANSKLIKYTPSTLKQQNITANYKVSEDKNRNNEKTQYYGNQTKWFSRRFSPCASKPRIQSRTCSSTGKETTKVQTGPIKSDEEVISWCETVTTLCRNNKRRESIGTLAELLKEKRSSEMQTDLPCCNKKLSTEIQTDLPSNKESLSAESQTELPSNKSSVPAEIQTEMPRNKILEPVQTQTELLRDQILNSSETQTELPRDDTSDNSSIQTQTAPEKDGNNMRRGEITSNQTQTAPENINVNRFYAVGYREDTMCNENKCRTLMDELRQKINNLVEELAETHNKYSTRIGRLEIEVQDYRNENMRVRLGRPVADRENEPCASFTRLLMNNLRVAESYGADLKMQLAIEKKKVNELLSLIRGNTTRQRMSVDVAAVLDAKKSRTNLDKNACSQHYNCDSDCPIAEILPEHKCTMYHFCKRGQNSTCCRVHDSPLNSIDSENNSQNTQNQSPDLQSQNAVPDLPNSKEIQNTLDTNTNIQKDVDLPTPSKPVSPDTKGTKGKRICNIYNNENQSRPSAPDAIIKESGLVSNVNNIQDLTKSENLPDGNQDFISKCQKSIHLFDNIRTLKVNADGSEGLPDSNYLQKIHNSSDGVHSFGVPEAGLNDNNRDLGDSDTMSNDKNEQEEIYNANLDQNNTGAIELQFQPRERCKFISDGFESRNKPNMLVTGLTDINEEQSKTVGELVRQMNDDSQRSVETTTIKQTSDDDFQPNEPRDLAEDIINITLPQDTTGIMRVISTHADDVNRRKSRQSSDKNAPTKSTEPRVPEETMSMQRKMSTFPKNQNDEVASENADAESIKPSAAKERNKRTSLQLPSVIPSSSPNQMKSKAPNAGIPAPVDIREINKVGTETGKNKCREAIELATKYNTMPRNIQNVPTRDNDLILSETVPGPVDLSTATRFETKDQATSMNDMYSQMGGNINSLKLFKTSDKDTQVKLKRAEKLETRNDFKNVNANPTPTQLEIATYRRNSGTLCFKTVPISKRSQHCQCSEQFHCEAIKNIGIQTEKEIVAASKNIQGSCTTGCSRSTRNFSRKGVDIQRTGHVTGNAIVPETTCIQTEKEIEEASKNIQGTCTTGCCKCTRTFARKNMDIQRTGNVTGNAIVPEATSTYYTSNAVSKNEIQLANTVPEGLTNYYMTNKEGAVKTNAIPRSYETGPKPNDNISRMPSQTPEPTAKMQEKLEAITEELLRVKKQLSDRATSVLIEATGRIQTNLENKASDEVVSEFDAGRHYVLKPGMAMHTMNANNTPKCVFVLHIGTVVLSDEAVLTSRGKCLALTWKFYDQDTTMTHMRAGRVVVFDFSTEYDLRLTDEFLNYMKHDELQIIICGLEEPNKPIASCSLPLRDALLNTNRRADMSLALVAGPQLVYARQANQLASDQLDSSDEMGVLDLWCMLRAEGQFLPRINKAIAGDLPSQAPDKREKPNEKPIVEPDLLKTENIKMPEEIRPTDECTLRRWGSSALRLPSKDLSRDRSMETRSVEGEDWTEGPEFDQASFFSSAGGSKHRDSIGYKTANTVEIDGGLMSKPRTSFSGKKLKMKMKQEAAQSRATKSTGVQYDDDYPDNIFVNEVIANIKTSDDMKRVMNRPSQHSVSIIAQDNDPPMQAGSSAAFAHKVMSDDMFKSIGKKSEMSQEPTVFLPRNSMASKRNEIINQKYNDIVNLYPRSNSPKMEGYRFDQSRKQVTIANNKKRELPINDKPQRDIPEEDGQIIEITVLWLALNEECEAMLNPHVQRVYVAYEFLGRSGADLETPVSLPKPKHYVDKCYFNFKKSFEIDKKDMPLLGQLARCRATSVSLISKSPNDCVVFSVISEPPEDPLGLEICEDIGYAYLFLGDLLAYSNGSSGYTEVIPVRSRTGTSVCGVLAVRLDGLDVLRQSLALVDQMFVRAQNRQA